METTRLTYVNAINVAHEVRLLLQGACTRIEIAGSLRRRRPAVKDIELVAIPKRTVTTDLFGEDVDYGALMLDGSLKRAGVELLKDGPRYKQFVYRGVKVDLFLTTPEKWGVIFTMRTGSAEYVTQMFRSRAAGGWMPSHLVTRDGRIWQGDVPLPTPEEVDVFAVAGMAWVAPEEREL